MAGGLDGRGRSRQAGREIAWPVPNRWPPPMTGVPRTAVTRRPPGRRRSRGPSGPGPCLLRVGEVDDVLGDPEHLAKNAAHSVLGDQAVGAGAVAGRDADADPAALLPGLQLVAVGAQRRLQRLQTCRVEQPSPLPPGPPFT